MSQQSVTYTWRVENMTVVKSENGLSDVIKNVQWRLIGESDDGIVADRAGILPFKEPVASEFIPLGDLNKDTVVAWLESTINSLAETERREHEAKIPKPDPENPDKYADFIIEPCAAVDVNDYKQQIIDDIARERDLAVSSYIPPWS